MATQKAGNAELGQALRELRISRNLLRAEVAKASGLHYVTIAQYETAVRTPSLDALTALGAALGVKPSYILAQAGL